MVKFQGIKLNLIIFYLNLFNTNKHAKSKQLKDYHAHNVTVPPQTGEQEKHKKNMQTYVMKNGKDFFPNATNNIHLTKVLIGHF